MRPTINRRKCPAQKDICKAIQACPTRAIYFVEDEEEALGGRIEINYEVCNACGSCVTECCGRAIEMSADSAEMV